MPLPIRLPAVAGCLALAVLLGGCGGSSKTTSTSAAAAIGGAPGARFTALRQCLAKSGINLPARAPGQRRPPGAGGGAGGGGVFGGGGGGGVGLGGAGGVGLGGAARRLPAGVTQAQFQAALAKCRGSFPGRGGGARLAANRAALVKFAACMRQNGIALPAPNTSGTGPVFNTAKLNTTSKQFTAARTKCASILPAGFGRRPPAPGGATTTPGGA